MERRRKPSGGVDDVTNWPGEIAVQFEQKETGALTLPEGLTGELHWHGKKVSLREGQQEISLVK